MQSSDERGVDCHPREGVLADCPEVAVADEQRPLELTGVGDAFEQVHGDEGLAGPGGEREQGASGLAPQLAAGDLVVWCACGRSERQPYCDGSHRGTSLRPMRYTVPNNLTVALCGCKQTKQPPFCDGSHLAYRAAQGEQKQG